MTQVLGVDAAAGEWFAVLLVDGRFAEAGLRPSISALLAKYPRVEKVAVDIPIGLPVGQSRPADAAARAFVGGARAPSVFSALPAEVYDAPRHAEAAKVAISLTRKGLSQQSYSLGKRIVEVAGLAERDDRIVEVHPEVSFRAIKGAPLQYSKHGWNGIHERRTLLATAGILLPDEVLSDDIQRGGRVAPDDVLDAAVAAWSAMRVAENRSSILPAIPSGDPADGGVIHY